MIELRDICVRAGEFQLRQFSLRIETGQYAVLMGRTGQGKTTILELLCGLRSPASGQVLINDVDVTHWSPGDRQIGYVPQDLALFPHMTVREHLEYALRLRRCAPTLIHERVNQVAEQLAIAPLLQRRIQGLSGGEAQRVALGRALSFSPQVLLLDEPLSALDEQTRHEMHALLKSIKQDTGMTTLHITHNSEDATALADVTLRLENGQVHTLSSNLSSSNHSPNP